ncbi:L,D-transpeptidase family protein [Streptomyces finlayi]|uniref:L,D-transpeptidase family protein n=1 Tax=Streptomyces finlayi TaxID=67296 RepID=A0A7G7BLV6_9ACTN|nr:L,D-transpeptidase family protein [Streptomyces finlayi]QNE76321.1 L,D-transpeptidase family protein [Streptomyces finlayi]
MSASRRPYATLAALLLLVLTGCSTQAPAPPEPRGAPGPQSMPASARPKAPRPAEIPALGPRTRAAIPATARQAVVVTGKARDSNRSTAVLYARDDLAKGWKAAAGPWPAHNGLEGWTDFHVAGDLKSPVGVYTLSDAGGRLPDPGARLPYDEHPRFALSGEGFFGESLEGSFDYVVAIDYNRTPGVTPLDRERPLGENRGGGIWLHVDHGGPTQGCVSLPEARMKDLLRALDPAKKPVIVMGDAKTLRR